MRNGCPFLSLGEALKRFSFSCILPILLAACMSTSTEMPILGLEATAAQARKGGYENATYLIEGQFVTLVDGFFEIESAPGSATRITTSYFGNEAFGDLNGDGMEDVAFLLTQSSGGSGIFSMWSPLNKPKRRIWAQTLSPWVIASHRKQPASKTESSPSTMQRDTPASRSPSNHRWVFRNI